MVKNFAIEWEQWAPFLPWINTEYGVRYRQHFSVLREYPTYRPKNREFYEQPWVIDGGSLMHELYLSRNALRDE